MMLIFAKLIRPYAEFIVAASYNLQQTLEGLGASVDTGHEAVVPGAAMYTILEPGIPIWLVVSCVALTMWLAMLLSLLASYCLGLRRGALVSLGVWLLPGCFSLMNLWPHYRGAPATIHLGTSGAIGSPWGMLPLVLVGLVTGWSLAILLVDLFGLGNRYQSYFDHLWVATAVITGVFFVADSSTRQNEQVLTETTENVRLGSNYLLQQVKRYEQAFCHNTALSADASCRWAADVQGKLASFAYNEYRFFWAVGPNSAGDLYAPYVRHPSTSSIDRLRVELDAVNQSLCGGTNRSQGEWCELTPANICNPDESHRDYMAMAQPVAISNECIIPMLIHLKTESAAEHSEAAAANSAKHWRHIYYMAFSIFAGAKIGNTTARLHEVGKESRTMRLFKGLTHFLFKACARTIRLAIFVARLIFKSITKVKGAIYRAVLSSARFISRDSKRDLPPD